MTDIRESARGWLSSESMALEGCIVRLGGIDNDHVNLRARDDQVARMVQRREEIRYLLVLIERDRSALDATESPPVE